MGRDARLNPFSKESTVELLETTLDARGRPLQEGDDLIVTIKGPFTFRVARIAPVLDKSTPANMLHVQLESVLLFAAARGKANPEFLRVATAEEIREAEKTRALAEARKTLVQP